MCEFSHFLLHIIHNNQNLIKMSYFKMFCIIKEVLIFLLDNYLFL